MPHAHPTRNRPLSIVLVKLAYYATSSARFFPNLCSNYARFWKLCSCLEIMLLSQCMLRTGKKKTTRLVWKTRMPRLLALFISHWRGFWKHSGITRCFSLMKQLLCKAVPNIVFPLTRIDPGVIDAIMWWDAFHVRCHPPPPPPLACICCWFSSGSAAISPTSASHFAHVCKSLHGTHVFRTTAPRCS